MYGESLQNINWMILVMNPMPQSHILLRLNTDLIFWFLGISWARHRPCGRIIMMTCRGDPGDEAVSVSRHQEMYSQHDNYGLCRDYWPEWPVAQEKMSSWCGRTCTQPADMTCRSEAEWDICVAVSHQEIRCHRVKTLLSACLQNLGGPCMMAGIIVHFTLPLVSQSVYAG